MCGISGFKNFSNQSDLNRSLENAIINLNKRGPDCQASFYHRQVGLGHTRLSIIDTSDKANQPMTDSSGRYTLVFNGEIYNYRELSKILKVDLKSTSDTEVLLYLLIYEGKSCLEKLNGFFSFAFYDAKDESMLLARDRMGIKPLHYFHNENFFAFASEMKALLEFPIHRKINPKALEWYLRLTYLPKEISMIDGIKKLLPGHFIEVKNNSVSIGEYWGLSKSKIRTENYAFSKKALIDIFEKSVERRMIADVPLGAFLSGGTDSSAVVSMACQFDKNLHTYSIGYKDHAFFDETNYAKLVASRFKTNHTTFSLTNNDLLESLSSMIDYIDEPFADSSALPTYILSKHVSKYMKVALSGDGADELFGGYYKHLAFANASKKNLLNSLVKSIPGLLERLPKSRSSIFGNQIRRISKYVELLNRNTSDRYLHLASFNHRPEDLLLSSSAGLGQLTTTINDLNDFLDHDLTIVLPGDMLTKVDLMSMANSLEVRVPFLDKDMVEFARSLPEDFKVKRSKRKRILQDAFEHILPKELHHRPKKGFEVPLLAWMNNELQSEIDQVVFNQDFLEHQQIFNTSAVIELQKKLRSNNPEDVHSTVWSLYVFQKWYNKYIQ